MAIDLAKCSRDTPSGIKMVLGLTWDWEIRDRM